MSWLQGRSDLTYRSQKPLRLRGDVSVAPDSFAIDGMKAELDGGTVEGRMAVSHPQPNGGARVEADLKAERLDLDAASAFLRSLAGPQAEWPEEAQLSLNVGHAISSGQELRPLSATLGYDPKTISLDRLKIGQPDGVTMEGEGRFDRANATGKLALNSSAASFNQLTALIAPFAPSAVARLNAMGTAPGPARAKLSIDLDKSPDRRIAPVPALCSISMRRSSRASPRSRQNRRSRPSTASISKRSSAARLRSTRNCRPGRARSLLALLGLDRAIAAGEGAARFEGSVSGAWGAPVQLKAKISGADLDAEAQGTAEPWAQEPKANVSLKIGSINLAPLLDLKPSDQLAQHIGLTSRLTVAGNKWTFDDLDSSVEGSRLRGRLALTLDQEKSVEGEIGLDTLALAPSFALAIGAAGHDADEPLGAGLVKGWRGRVTFQALRGVLPGGIELQQLGGTVKADGQSLTLDDIKGRIGGGDLTANIDVRPGANGLSLNARLQLSGVDGSALRYRALAMPAGRASVQMALASQGRSASALIGALSGNGTVTLELAKFAGLDPRAFEVAVRASDNGQAKDDIRLKQIVEPALSAGALMVASAQIPFIIRDGRMRVSATTIDTQGVRAVISGGYDIPADQADIRAALALTMALPTSGRPEIQLFAVGTPDAMSRSVDVAALSSWLAVRAIDHETRRLDAIERGEPPPPPPAPITIPADAAQDVLQPPREPRRPCRCRRAARRRQRQRPTTGRARSECPGACRASAASGSAACACAAGGQRASAGCQPAAGRAAATADRSQACAGCGREAEAKAAATTAGADAAAAAAPAGTGAELKLNL